MHSPDFIHSLPCCIYFHVKTYLDHQDYRSFLYSSNSFHFQDVRKKTIFYDLDVYYSWKYLTNLNHFQSLVLSKITDKANQLSLDLTNFDISRLLPYSHEFQNLYSISFDDLRPYGSSAGVPSLPVPSISNLTIFKNIHKLCLLNSTTIEDCNGLENITELQLYDFSKLKDISHLSALVPSSSFSPSSFTYLQTLCLEKCPLLLDVNCLGNVAKLYIRRCKNISDVTGLGKENQKKVQLEELPKITDISSLRNLDALTLRNCDGVTNIDCLTNVLSLDISFCHGITKNLISSRLKKLTIMHCPSLEYPNLLPDTCPSLKQLRLYSISIDMLRQWEKIVLLELFCCDTVSDVSGLVLCSNLKYVTFQECVNISDVTMLGFLRRISIFDCPITSLKGLGNIYQVSLTDCNDLTSLEGLGANNHCVMLSNCTTIEDFTLLRHCYKVMINGGEGFRSLVTRRKENGEVETFNDCNVHILYLKSLSIRHVSEFSYIRNTIMFCDCFRLKKIIGLENVLEVYVSNCKLLEDVRGLGRNNKVVLHSCSKLTDVKSLAKLPFLQIQYCTKIEDYSCLSTVARLELKFSDSATIPFHIGKLKNVYFKCTYLNYHSYFVDTM
jgi:hypothetical protein